MAIAKHLPGRQNKFISNHFKESVARKVEIFVNAKGKQSKSPQFVLWLGINQ